MGKTKILAAAAALLLSSASAFAQYVDPVSGATFTPIEGTNFYAGEGASKACDGDSNTKLGTSECPNFVVVEASSPVVMNGYTIITANDNASYKGRNPQNWKIEGSNDNRTWTNIVTVENDNVLQDVNFTPFDFAVEGQVAAYKYFRFTVTRVVGGGFMQYSEFNVHGTAHEHAWDAGVAVAATCVSKPSTLYTCATCGATKSEIDEAGEYGPHTYSTRVCVDCGHVGGAFEALSVTGGFNADVVVEAMPVADHLVGGFDNGTVGFYTTGIEYADGQYYNDHGLPVDGHLVSNAGQNIDYYLGYGANSALRIGGDNDAHVVNVAPAYTAAIAVLGTSAGGPSNTDVTVTYADGTTTVGHLSWADWCGGATDGVAYLELNRFWGDTRQENLNFRLFEKVILTDPTKKIVSVTFRQNGTFNTPVIMAMSAAKVDYSPYAAAEAGEGEYFLYNVKLGKWLGDNDHNTAYGWTSHAEVGDRGREFGFTVVDGGYNIDPHMGNNHSLINGGLWMDTNNPRSTWTLTPVTLEGVHTPVYAIDCGAQHLTTNAWGDMDENSSYNNAWQLVSREERMAVETANATPRHPAAISWAIRGGNFPVADDFLNEWTREFDGGNNVNGGDGNGVYYMCNRAFESWNSKAINMYTVVTGLPNGVYKLGVQGYYRDGSIQNFGTKHTDGTEVLRSYYFANDSKNLFQSIIAGGADEKSDNRYYYEADGKWVPDGLQAASAIFFEGGYKNPEIIFMVKDGTAKIGVEKVGDSENGNWTVFDNFTLTYLGDVMNEDGIFADATYAVAEDEKPAVAVNFVGRETIFVNNYATEDICLVDAADNVVAKSVETSDNYSLETYACDVTTFFLSEVPAEGEYKLVIPAGSLVMGEGADFHLNHVDVVVPVTVATPAVLAKKGDVTAIQNVQNAVSNNRIYNLQGVEVKNTNKPGLYIINGKKHIVK